MSETSARYTQARKPSVEEEKGFGNQKNFSESCHDLRFKIKNTQTGNNRLSLVNWLEL